ncbi:hypothetical protein GCM10028805_28450 [Spirosoma harenae]
MDHEKRGSNLELLAETLQRIDWHSAEIERVGQRIAIQQEELYKSLFLYLNSLCIRVTNAIHTLSRFISNADLIVATHDFAVVFVS